MNMPGYYRIIESSDPNPRESMKADFRVYFLIAVFF